MSYETTRYEHANAGIARIVLARPEVLAWVCDLIVASDDATFKDPVGTFGVNGVEWFSKPWELGRPQGQGKYYSSEMRLLLRRRSSSGW